jgi:hypothetical protein
VVPFMTKDKDNGVQAACQRRSERLE